MRSAKAVYSFIFTILTTAMLAACGPASSSSSRANKAGTPNDIGGTKQWIDYVKTISEDRPPIKLSIDVRLPHRVTKEELQVIAEVIRQEHGQYDRVFVSYWLPGMVEGQGAWATTHFAPEMEVRILGSDMQTESTLVSLAKQNDSSKEYVGQWKASDGPGFSSVVRISRSVSAYQWESLFVDGANRNDLIAFIDKDERRFVTEGRIDDYLRELTDSEFYRIDSDGYLAVCGTETGTALKYPPLSFSAEQNTKSTNLTLIEGLPTLAELSKQYPLHPLKPRLKQSDVRELAAILHELEVMVADVQRARNRYPRGDQDLARLSEAGRFSRTLVERREKMRNRIDAIKPPTGNMGPLWFSIIELDGAFDLLNITTNLPQFDRQLAFINGRTGPIRSELKRQQSANLENVSWRKWTSGLGQHTIEAKLLRVEDGMAQLEKPDGTIVEVRLEKLSDRDRLYIKANPHLTR